MALNPPAIIPTKITTIDRLALPFVEQGTQYLDITLGAVVMTDNGGAPGVAIWRRVIGACSPYTQINQTTVSATTTATSILDETGGNGSVTVPANTLKKGDRLHMKIGGRLRTTGPGQAITFFLGTDPSGGDPDVIAQQQVTGLNINSLSGWEAEVDLKINEDGAALTAIILTNGQITYRTQLGTDPYRGEFMIGNESTKFDTTTSTKFEFWAQWTVNDVNNILETDFYNLDIIKSPIT